MSLKVNWLFKQRFNKLDSAHYRDLSTLEIDQVINDAQFLFLEKNVFAELQPQFDMISNLVVTQPEQPALLPISETNDVYEFDLSELEYPYYHYKRAYAKTDCGLVKVEIAGHNKLSDILTDEFQKPSKKWRKLVGAFAKKSIGTSQSLYIYSEANFAISELYLEYVRKPKQYFSGGYDSLEYLDCKTINTNSNCSQFNSRNSLSQNLEINPDYHTLIVDIAVREAARILKDIDSVNLNNEKINQIN